MTDDVSLDRRGMLGKAGLGAAAVVATYAIASPEASATTTVNSWFDVKDAPYGAAGTGLVNDAPKIQAAINAAQTAGGGIVYLPKGVYRLDSGLTINRSNVGIVGVGRASVLRCNFAAGDVIHVEPTGVPVEPFLNNAFFEMFAMETTVNKTSGAAIGMVKSVRSRIVAVKVRPLESNPAPTFFHGFTFVDFDYNYVNNVYVDAAQDAISLSGPAVGAGFYLDGGSKIIGTRGVALMGNAGGVSIADTDIIGCKWGMTMDDSATPGRPNREVFINNTTIDGSQVQGIAVAPGGVALLHINASWIASAPWTNANPWESTGITVAQPNGACTVILSGTRIFNNGGAGVFANAGAWTITGCSIYNNGKGPGGGCGIDLYQPAVSDVVISGNELRHNDYRPGTPETPGILPQLRIALNIPRYVVTGNLIYGHSPLVTDPNTLGPAKVRANNAETT